MLQSLKEFLPRVISSPEACRASFSHAVRRPTSQRNVPRDFRLPLLNDLDIYEITIDELQCYLSDKSFTSVDLVHFCLQRIHSVGAPLRLR